MKKIISCIISLFFVFNMILPLSVECLEENTEYECIRLPIISDQLKETVTKDITLYKENDILYVPLHIVCPLINAYWNVQDGGFIVDRDSLSFRYYDENNMKLIIDFERGDAKWNKTDNILLEGNLLSCKKFGVEWCVDFIKFCDMFGATFYQVYQGNIKSAKEDIQKTLSATDTNSWNDIEIEKELDFEENPYYIFVYSGVPLSSFYDKVMNNQDVYLWDYSCYKNLNLIDKEDKWIEKLLQSIKYSDTTTGLKIQSENVLSNIFNDDWGITKILLAPPYKSTEHYKKSLVNISCVNYSPYLNKNDLKPENNSKAEELEKLLNTGTITSSLSSTADNILKKYLNDTEMFGKLNTALDIINISVTPYQKYCEINEFNNKLNSINETKINLLKKSLIENDFINKNAKKQGILNDTFNGISIEIPLPNDNFNGTFSEIPLPSTTRTPLFNIMLNSVDNYEGLLDSANKLCSLYKNSNKQFVEELYTAIESGVYAIGDTFINTALSESGDPHLALVSSIITIYDGFTAWTKDKYGEQLQKSENLVQSYFVEKTMLKSLDIKNPENLYNRLTLMLQSSLCCFEYDEEYFQSNRNSIAKMLYTLDINTSLNINYYHDPRNNNVDENIKNAILNFDSAKNDDSNYKWYLAPTIEAEDIINSDEDVHNFGDRRNYHYPSDEYSVIKQNGKYGIIMYDGTYYAEADYENGGFGSFETNLYVGNTIPEGGSFNDLEEIAMFPDENQIKVSNYRGGRGFMEHKYLYNKADNKIYYIAYASDKAHLLNGSDLSSKSYSNHEIFITEQYDFDITKLNDKKIFEVFFEPTKFGISNKTELLVPCEYDNGCMNNCGNIVALEKDGKWGFFNKNGEQIIDFICDSMENKKLFSDWYPYGYVYNQSKYPYLATEGYIPVKIDGKCGYYDTQGNEVIPCGTFEEVRPVHNGLAWVKKDGKWGVIKLNDIETDISNSNSSETTNWRQLYADELKRYMASDEYNNETMFDLYDVNNDNIPELFISTGVSHADGCLIYTVLNEKIQKLEKYYELAGCGEYGLINCSSSIQTIFSSWAKSGNYFMDYYQIQNDKFVHILEAYNDTANVGLENATYKINNETVTVEKYNEEISKYEADDYIEVGRKYKLDEEIINSILLSEE